MDESDSSDVPSMTKLRKQVTELGNQLGEAQDFFTSAEPEVVSVTLGHDAECSRLAIELKDLTIAKHPAKLHVFLRSFNPADNIVVDFTNETFCVSHNGKVYQDLPLSKLPAYWITDGYKPVVRRDP